MQPNRIRRSLAIAPAALLLPRFAAAQLGSHPVTVVVPFSPGGSTDLVARLVAQYASPGLGTSMVVENRLGGGGVVGWNSAARSTPDGSTVLVLELSYAIAAGLITNLPFDPRRAFEQVTTAVRMPHVLVVNPGVPANTVQEFIALAKKEPGKLNYGSGGNGTNTHLAGELFKSITGTNLVHIPYKGAGAVLADLMSGQVQALITSVPTALPYVGSGKLRPLMVTGAQRNAMLPGVPTAAESGIPKMDIDFWIGFAVPAGTPQPAIDKLHAAIVESLSLPDVKKRIGEFGITALGSTPAQATALLNTEIDRWSAVIQAAGIKAD